MKYKFFRKAAIDNEYFVYGNLACVHACPKKAIGLNIPEKNSNARYRIEHISLQKIIAANEQ